jgi:hypothetical protein
MVARLRLPDGQIKEVPLADWWVKASGEWYHVIRDLLFFPGV